MKKILIIEDDIWISNSLKLYFENSNYNTSLCHNWGHALRKIAEINPDLIILDINLPEKNWMEICKELREFSSIPVIMLTARDSEFDRISGLEIWADDYIAKPFSPRELLARVHVILKRTEKNQSKKVENTLEKNTNILIYKNIVINIEKKVVEIEKSQINLTKNEYDLLNIIVNKDWKVVSREKLMTDILGYENYVYDRTLDTHIKNLRKKIDIWTDVILTIRWEWYRLNK